MFIQKRNGRKGFTITEILIAVLLVLILSAIAIPRLLGNQRQADDTAAKAQLRTAAEVARNLMYEAGGNFSTADYTTSSSRIQLDEPNIEFVAASTPSTSTGNRRSVSVSARNSNQEWVGASIGGDSGGQKNCWFVKLDARGADMYYVTNALGASGCSASAAPASTVLNTTSGGAAANGWTKFDFPSAP